MKRFGFVLISFFKNTKFCFELTDSLKELGYCCDGILDLEFGSVLRPSLSSHKPVKTEIKNDNAIYRLYNALLEFNDDSSMSSLLLQDLSAARYSGHMERRETVTESRVYTSHTGYQVPYRTVHHLVPSRFYDTLVRNNHKVRSVFSVFLGTFRCCQNCVGLRA